ncbi:hypothetical protein [Rhodopseudomonas sp. P2A-2r]|nr:hypothetical protein [Rhodopseudomonas sp. P2A-2r]UZE47594.1 hypothetical protein ONR75_22180 [Rhodopseudomonas sp. P2A-2r]
MRIALEATLLDRLFQEIMEGKATRLEDAARVADLWVLSSRLDL